MSTDPRPLDLELADRLISFLNELAALDPKAIEALIKTRVPCEAGLANHPTVQVRAALGDDGARWRVGLLGVLNGICGAFPEGHRWAGSGPIAVVIDAANPVQFERLDRRLDCEEEEIPVVTNASSPVRFERTDKPDSPPGLPGHNRGPGLCEDEGCIIRAGRAAGEREMEPERCWFNESCLGVIHVVSELETFDQANALRWQLQCDACGGKRVVDEGGPSGPPLSLTVGKW